MKTECPKCGSGSAWLKVEGPDLWLRCLCGVNKLLATKLKLSTIENVDQADSVTLPRTGSKLWDTLVTISMYAPVRTDKATELVNLMRGDTQTISEVSSQLTVLKHKGLVEAIVDRKGFEGGSTWRVCSRALELLRG